MPPRMFACREHWFALPKNVRDAIWREYRPGQEIDKKPSLRYLAVQRFACARLAFVPHDEEAGALTLALLKEAEVYRKRAIKEGLGDPLEAFEPKMPKTKRRSKR